MNTKTLILAALLFIPTACNSQPVMPAVTAVPSPIETLLPASTATFGPTGTPPPTQPASDVFGAIPLNSVQAFNIEPVAKAVFDQALREHVTQGSVQEYRVDRIVVFPSGDGTLVAEIFYSLRTDADPWLEDGGTAGTQGWTTGKCSRFDLTATETEHQLTNKRLCS